MDKAVLRYTEIMAKSEDQRDESDKTWLKYNFNPETPEFWHPSIKALLEEAPTSEGLPKEVSTEVFEQDNSLTTPFRITVKDLMSLAVMRSTSLEVYEDTLKQAGLVDEEGNVLDVLELFDEEEEPQFMVQLDLQEADKAAFKKLISLTNSKA